MHIEVGIEIVVPIGGDYAGNSGAMSNRFIGSGVGAVIIRTGIADFVAIGSTEFNMVLVDPRVYNADGNPLPCGSPGIGTGGVDCRQAPHALVLGGFKTSRGRGKVICIVTLGTKTTVGRAADGRAIACRGWHRGCAG